MNLSYIWSWLYLIYCGHDIFTVIVNRHPTWSLEFLQEELWLPYETFSLRKKF